MSSLVIEPEVSKQQPKASDQKEPKQSNVLGQVNVIDPVNQQITHIQQERFNHSGQKDSKNIMLSHQKTEKEKNAEKLEIRKRLWEQFSKDDPKYEEKVKQWNQNRLQIKKRRQILIRREKMAAQEKQEEQKKKVQQFQAKFKELRLQQIKKNLEAIEERKSKRAASLKQTHVIHHLKPPVYMEYQKKFKEMQRREIQQRIQKIKARKLLMSIDHAVVKQHEKNYLKMIQEKRKDKQIKSQKSLNVNVKEIEENFNVKFTNYQNLKQQEKQKRKRIKKFMEEVKSKGYVSEQNLHKRKKSQRDEQTNPEYKKKKNSKRLHSKRDEKELGNSYLREVRSKIMRHSAKKLSSSNSANLGEIHKLSYHNYLQDLRRQRIIRGPIKKKQNQLEKMSQSYSLIRKRLSLEQHKLLKNIAEMKGIKSYDKTIQKQHEIDDLYSKLIHMKLACVQQRNTDEYDL